MTFHLRRTDEEATDEKLVKKILKTSTYVTIALSLDNQPYLLSLSHGYDEQRNCLYFHCAKEGKKLHYLKSNNVVCARALLDYVYSGDGECTHLYASVHFSGKVTLIESLEEKRRVMEYMIKQLDRNPEALVAGMSLDRLKNTVIGRIDVEYMSCKKSKEVVI